MPSFNVRRPPEPGGDTARRLPYLPAIDGLRAIAVLAVVLYHAAPGTVPGGFFGVDVFFVISGYLITSFLWNDWKRNRDLGVKRFWFSRARRLLPAVAVLIFGLLLFAVFFLTTEVAGLRDDALAAAAYVTNWYLIIDDQSYFENFNRPSLLRHLWSLAIEEQFYLVWPLVLVLVLPRFSPKQFVPVILGVAVASWVLMAILYEPGADPSRVYYGTDTRAGGLFIGAAMAFIWNPWESARPAQRRASLALNVAGFFALAGIVLAFAWFEDTDDTVYRGGFALVSLLSAVAIAAAARPWTIPGRIIGTIPFVWVGVRSYSIYLWHWPVLMLTRPGIDVDMHGTTLWIFRVVLLLTLSEVSYRFVEKPIRNGAAGRWWRSLRAPGGASLAARIRPLAAAGAVFAFCMLVGLRAGSAERPEEPAYFSLSSVSTVSWSDDVPGRADRIQRDDQPSPVITASPTPSPAPPPPRTPPPSERPVIPTVHPTVAPTPQVTPWPTPPPPPSLPPVAGRVLAVGDSVMLGAVPNLQALGTVEVDAAVSRQFPAGTDILTARYAAGTLGDVVVVHLGDNGLITGAQFDQMMSVLAGVQRVVFVNLKLPRDWEGPNNALLAAKAAQYGNAVVADWYAVSSSHPEYFLDDGLHLKPEGAQAYASLLALYL